MSKTLGSVMNGALELIGEPVISAIDTTNLLHNALIREANNAVRDILARYPFDWGLKRTTLITTDDVTTGTVSVTNGSTTVTSSGDNFTDVATTPTLKWFRVVGDSTSYAIASVTTAASPDTLTLATAYRGTTNATASYVVFQDTYALTDSDLDEVRIMAYGDALNWATSLQGVSPDQRLGGVTFSELMSVANGDLHRDTSGRPKLYARISVNSSDQPRYVLWPYPTDDYQIEVWYSILYSENTTFATNLFSGDAPADAADAVEARMKWRALKYERRRDDANDEWQIYQSTIANLLRRENRPEVDHSVAVERYGRGVVGGFPARSSTYFDTKSARR